MVSLKQIGAIKSLAENGIQGLFGSEQVDKEILQNVPADLAQYPHFQITSLSYVGGLLSIGHPKLKVSGVADASQFIDGARVLIVSPLGYRVLTHISEIEAKGEKVKLRLNGLDSSIVRQMCWVVMVGDAAEFSQYTDGQVFGDRSPIMLVRSFSRLNVPIYRSYVFDGWMACGDFVEGEEVTVFKAMTRFDAKIAKIDTYDTQVDGVNSHRAKIKIQLIFGDLAGDVSRSTSTKITVVRKEPKLAAEAQTETPAA